MAKKKKMTPKEKQKTYEKSHAALLKRLDLKIMQVIDFPGRSKLPVLSWLALKIILKQGGRISLRYVDLTK